MPYTTDDQSPRTRHVADTQDDLPEQPTRMPSSVTRLVPREYAILLADGRTLYVTEQKLLTMDEDYRRAARQVPPGTILNREQRQPRRQPKPNVNTASPPPVILGRPARERERITEEPRRRGFRAHPVLYLGIGMLLMLVLWVVGSALVTWAGHKLDDITYGNPRTYQFNAVFGHNDSAANPTHIIIINLNRHVVVIEIPGGDASHTRSYNGPLLIGDGQDVTPVTGKAVDVNHDGKPDLVLYIQDQRFVLINDKGQFRQLNPGEQVNLP